MSILVVAFIAGLYLLNGVVLKVLWGWFLIPTLNFPPISLAQAIGIGIIAGFLTNQYIPRKKDEKIKAMIIEVISPPIALLVGWIVHLFM